MIADKAAVPVSQVSRVIIWGNHSHRACIDLRHAKVGDQPALEAIHDPAWIKDVMEPTILTRNRQILRIRGSTPAGAVAQAILTAVHAIMTPTPFERWFAAGVVSDGSYGVPGGLVFGFPLFTADGRGWSIVDGLYIDEPTRDRIAQNVAELEHEAAAMSHLLGAI